MKKTIATVTCDTRFPEIIVGNISVSAGVGMEEDLNKFSCGETVKGTLSPITDNYSEWILEKNYITKDSTVNINSFAIEAKELSNDY